MFGRSKQMTTIAALLGLAHGSFIPGMWSLPIGIRPSRTRNKGKKQGNSPTDFSRRRNGKRECARRMRQMAAGQLVSHPMAVKLADQRLAA